MLLALDANEIASETHSLAPAEDRDSEAKLTSEITNLWSAHQDVKATGKRTRAELQNLRRDLGERLHSLKTLLARTGRAGQWSAFLREHRIPRASADRHVRAHEATLNPQPVNRVSESIPEPTEADMKQFFNRLLPRLRQVLTTQQRMFDFACALVVDLPGVHGDVTDSAVEIYRPTQKSEAQ